MRVNVKILEMSERIRYSMFALIYKPDVRNPFHRELISEYVPITDMVCRPQHL